MKEVLTVSETTVEGLPLVHRGKVRDVYQVNEQQLLLVATDRLSAFDCILPTPIKYKGQVLTLLSDFWFKRLGHLAAHHLLTADFEKMPEAVRKNENLRGRSMLVRKTKVFPVECVVRGYLEGSGWKDYQATGVICGHVLPENLEQCGKLTTPICYTSLKLPPAD